MTGLVNRTLFNELLERAIARDRRYGRRFAVLFIDLDRFKIINDSLGHESGDALLKVMASRLRASVRDERRRGAVRRRRVRAAGEEFHDRRPRRWSRGTC